MAVLVVAALSARAMAEAAARDGFEVVALDLFGDADTRRASVQWMQIGEPAHMRIDPARLLGALASVARRGDVIGWVAGGGFDGLPDVLQNGAAVLPLLGTAPAAVRQVRDPAAFFGFLASRAIAHPEVQWSLPPDARWPEGWLLKDAYGCGGWHIRRAPAKGVGARPEHHYFQREMAGEPMSATFIANGREARVLGFNELIVRRIGTRPFVYCGVVGPVPVPDSVAVRVAAALDALVAEFSLIGLGSLDFMLDGQDWGVLEVNPRPPASLVLYGAGLERGVMGAHVAACLHGELPQSVPPPPSISGSEVVFARCPLMLGAAAVRRLASRPHVHDVPHATMAFETGDPVCSVMASGACAREVRQRLAAECDELLHDLEMST